MNGVGRVADQCQAFSHIPLGMPLTQGHTQARVGAQHFTEPTFKGPLQCLAETLFIHRHQTFGFAGCGRPDDRTPILLAVPLKG
ncbi:hypothetical protein D3C76_988080 [compost metagenome]